MQSLEISFGDAFLKLATKTVEFRFCELQRIEGEEQRMEALVLIVISKHATGTRWVEVACASIYFHMKITHLFIKSARRMTTHSKLNGVRCEWKNNFEDGKLALRSPFVGRPGRLTEQFDEMKITISFHSTMSQSTYYFPIEQTLCARRRAKQRPQYERLRTIKHPIKTHSQPPYAFTSTPLRVKWDDIGKHVERFSFFSILHIALRYCVLVVINGTSQMCKHRAEQPAAATLYWYLYWHSLMTW